MSAEPDIQPFSYHHRSFFFYLLVTLFIVAIPFLILYATGYRFSLTDTKGLISTGGIYVAVERTGAEIYIDNELVRETRAFRRAFYAQNLTPGTHRVLVQKEGHHIWIKDLPVYPHLVTEAQAFNMPLVPQVRVISPWKDAQDRTVLFASSTLAASTTNIMVVATSTRTTEYIPDTEYATLVDLFSTTSATSSPTFFERVTSTLSPNATTSAALSEATTTKEQQGVRLIEQDDEVYAVFVGSRESMPYYYCAEEFELLGSSTPPLVRTKDPHLALTANAAELMQPVQEIAEDTICDPVIRIDRLGQDIISFDFFPGSTDLVIMALTSGVYVIEVDDRAWQNAQPLVSGTGLDMRVINENVYVYDGTHIYQVLVEN